MTSPVFVKMICIGIAVAFRHDDSMLKAEFSIQILAAAENLPIDLCEHSARLRF